MAQIIKRGLLLGFNASSYTAMVSMLDGNVIRDIPVATHMDPSSLLSGAACAVLFFDENNHTDAVVLAVYPQGNYGVPTPLPGRVTMLIPPYRPYNGTTFEANTTTVATFTGGSTGIPVGVRAILCSLQSAPTSGAGYVVLKPTNLTPDIGMGIQTSQGSVAGVYEKVFGILPMAPDGKVNVRTINAKCAVVLEITGYIL
ncbi:hypothetical protein EI42_04943 [Thermosporothrix hazakensis]|jgi:hypothetical protein|uniref:Uncharacterized protein n=2 Tax=Thermosporothrix TaxID=768650 RepID=A0A326U3T2_THEHA|nr:hypothetical protein [Thermosporothrix hazakensis]PZW23560.1 hypothetical protein EI42_04943 [Thermosporothrix hazakensis]BBH86771.1 hypothetical protein KTC_15220 [Thermosporothrix sp. COM3]GCE51074.1 hypothetical protein KTH_59430 [Thermosporothrix hazakensis]